MGQCLSNARCRKVRGALALVCLASLLASTLTVSPASAASDEPTVTIKRRGHPASIIGGQYLSYRLRVDELPGNGVSVGVKVHWSVPYPGDPLPSAAQSGLVAADRDGELGWDKILGPISSAEDRPMLARVQIIDPDDIAPANDIYDDAYDHWGFSGYNVGSADSLLIAVNPQLSVVDASATEGTDSHLIFRVKLAPQATETVTVEYATSDGTATADDDYTQTSGTLTFNVGDTVKTISVPIVNDTEDDSGEKLTLTLSSPSGVTRLVAQPGGFTLPGDGRVPLGECRVWSGDTYCNPGGYSPVQFAATVSATGTILNTEPGPDPSVDDLPLVTIQADSAYAGEGSDAVFTLTRTSGFSEALTVPVSVHETGTMLNSAAPTSATFAAGDSETELRVPTDDDDAFEADSVVTVEIEPGSLYRLGANASQEATATVLNDDAAPVPVPASASPGVTVWSADMTVVDYGSGGSIGAGSADLFSNQGGSEGLQAMWLWYSTSERSLRLAFTTNVNTDELRLHAGDVVLAFPEQGSVNSGFTWEDVDDPGWTDGETLAVRLVRGQREASASHTATEESVEPPSAPQNLAATVNNDGSITLTWDAPGDDSVTGCQILRRTAQDGHALLVYVTDTGSTATTFTDTDVTAGIRHTYRVKAINQAGLGTRSKRVQVIP
ncbi:Calx-beta domain-containing protein [Candidatus Poriferisodalis sp.]|uniref:Calx-beta domain-containing protein n=1 Tax=Candidatus Poriferisodalis sp. TaxID=3101277 RepID=UPI003B59347C